MVPPFDTGTPLPQQLPMESKICPIGKVPANPRHFKRRMDITETVADDSKAEDRPSDRQNPLVQRQDLAIDPSFNSSASLISWF